MEIAIRLYSPKSEIFHQSFYRSLLRDFQKIKYTVNKNDKGAALLKREKMKLDKHWE